MKAARKKRQKPSKFFVILMLTIFLYFFIQSIYTNGLRSVQLVDAEHGIIENSINTKAIVVRDELVIHANISGNIEYLKEEGERVSSTTEVAKIVRANNDQRLISQLEIINNKINDHSNDQEGSLFNSDIEKLNLSIESIVKEIENNALKGNTSQVEELRKKLENEIDKKYEIIQNTGVEQIDYNWLLEEKERLSSQLKENVEILYAKMPGVICFSVDGYENILIPSNIPNFKSSALNNIEVELIKTNNGTVDVGQPVLKIIENHRWYISFITNKETAKLISEKSVVEVRKKGDMEIIPFKVYNINEEQDDVVIVSLTTSHFHEDFLTERTLDVEVVVSKSEGLKLPMSSVTEVDGQKGVMTVDFNGLAVFKPIEIIGQNEKYIVIGKDPINDTDTVELYDKVVVKGKKVKPNQIVAKPVIN